MSTSIAAIYARLVSPDPLRESCDFSKDFAAANQNILGAATKEEVAGHLRAWLQRHQPCLFGRLAARNDLLSFCLLTEADILKGDEYVQAEIQRARTEWTASGFKGKKSGFIVLAVSHKLARATPNERLLEFALKLCSLYLLSDIEPDQIYHDEIWLELAGAPTATWAWLAGVNVFSAAGDGRWWQDHRIPGGLGFSVNSVGHMVKAELLSRAYADLNQLLGIEASAVSQGKIDSLGTALEFAMRTISMASMGPSGKATELIMSAAEAPTVTCSISLPDFLKDKNHCIYRGYYHTDFTVPSEYFRPDVKRPDELVPHVLDFTYLFDPGAANPAHTTMGTGRRVRSAATASGTKMVNAMTARVDQISNFARLVSALHRE